MPPSGDNLSASAGVEQGVDKSPFGKIAIMDWKARTVRTPYLKKRNLKKSPLYEVLERYGRNAENGEVELVKQQGGCMGENWEVPSPANAIDTVLFFLR